jgi:hypothetical protein
MAKYRKNVWELVETNGNLTRDTFLCEKDIRNIGKKLAKETYKKHENDAKSVRMWVQENQNVLFYYRESGSEVGGELLRSNIPFTIEI